MSRFALFTLLVATLAARAAAKKSVRLYRDAHTFGEPALEGLDVRIAGGAKFFRGGGGVERTFARAVNNKRCSGIEPERIDVIEEGGLRDARVYGTPDARGGENFRWQTWINRGGAADWSRI
jgi:hypothetical protein